jgi:hypothetical protein
MRIIEVKSCEGCPYFERTNGYNTVWVCRRPGFRDGINGAWYKKYGNKIMASGGYPGTAQTRVAAGCPLKKVTGPKISERALELYSEFILNVLDPTVELGMKEFNLALGEFLKQKHVSPIRNGLLWDAVFDCKDAQLLEDLGVDGKLPEGDYSDCGV